jgi:protoheme IX farnesyltransferase
MKPERRLFSFSILYLFVLFAALVADRWLVS